MTIPVGIPPEPVPERSLNFEHTVDPELIHRQNPSESFLTDVVPTGPLGFIAAALLPEEHPHYTAHTGPSGRRDPMLLLECARQAVTYAAHTMFGVDTQARFLLRATSASFPAPAAPASAGPTELVLTATTSSPRLVRGKVQGLDYELELQTADSWAGRVTMDVGFISGPAYAMIPA